MLNDMQFVYDTLSVQYHENHIIVYGRSMGSGFATKVAADNTPRYLIIDSPYLQFQEGSWTLRPYFAITPLAASLPVTHRQMDHESKLPPYIIHGTRDRLIPLSHSENLQQLNPE